MVDSSNAEGAFITEIEVFFQKKDEVDGCQVYLTDTVGQVPTENIIPHGFARKPSNSTLRVQCDLSGSTESIVAGTRLVGQTSGATGIVGFTATFEDRHERHQERFQQCLRHHPDQLRQRVHPW